MFGGGVRDSMEVERSDGQGGIGVRWCVCLVNNLYPPCTHPTSSLAVMSVQAVQRASALQRDAASSSDDKIR